MLFLHKHSHEKTIPHFDPLYILLLIVFRSQAQEAGNSNVAVPEHGFLPGKEFKYYLPVDHYDFGGRRMWVVVYDDRDKLHITRLDCAQVDINLCRINRWTSDESLYIR
ncbi:MAG TPA: hypothetical protein VHC48_04420 [Puia sp.]|nr:hypothetical protein [Puia sp.]